MDDDEKIELAARVKQIQRDGEESKHQWWAFCDAEGRGFRDPTRHSVDFLRRFFELRESGGLPAVQPLHAAADSDLHEALVKKVKASQRSSELTKQAWWRYCDSQKGGIRDPQRHDVASLQHFFSSVMPSEESPSAWPQAWPSWHWPGSSWPGSTGQGPAFAARAGAAGPAPGTGALGWGQWGPPMWPWPPVEAQKSRSRSRGKARKARKVRSSSSSSSTSSSSSLPAKKKKRRT